MEAEFRLVYWQIRGYCGLFPDDEALGNYFEWVLRKLGNENALPCRNPNRPQGGRVDGRATTCPQSWELLNREIRVATCVGTLQGLVQDCTKFHFHSRSTLRGV